MKITRVHLRVALYVLGAALVLFTLLKLLVPRFSLGPTIDQNLPSFVMIGAMVIFFWNRDLWKKEQADAERARLDENAAGADGGPSNSVESKISAPPEKERRAEKAITGGVAPAVKKRIVERER